MWWLVKRLCLKDSLCKATRLFVMSLLITLHWLAERFQRRHWHLVMRWLPAAVVESHHQPSLHHRDHHSHIGLHPLILGGVDFLNFILLKILKKSTNDKGTPVEKYISLVLDYPFTLVLPPPLTVVLGNGLEAQSSPISTVAWWWSPLAAVVDGYGQGCCLLGASELFILSGK